MPGTRVRIGLITAGIAMLLMSSAASWLLSQGRVAERSCSSHPWRPTLVRCAEAYGLGDQAGAKVARAHVWLSTLGQANAVLGWSRQTEEPSTATPVWVIAYEGRWLCCPNAYGADGSVIPQADMSRWLVVADASATGAGFIYLGDWSGRPILDALPPWEG
jgi:hypothetical protein